MLPKSSSYINHLKSNIMFSKIKKKVYTFPAIQYIRLDNEISLALQSQPPVLPGETLSLNKNSYLNNNPYYDNLS